MTVPGAARLDVAGRSGLERVAWYAERALLGALLHRPVRIQGVAGWLGAKDFADANHRAVFVAISRVFASDGFRPMAAAMGSVSWEALDPGTRQDIALNMKAVRSELETGEFGEPVAGNPQALLHDLYAERATGGQGQYLRYGRMVLETSIRRTIEEWGARLEYAVSDTSVVVGDTAVLNGTHEAMVDNLMDLSMGVARARGGGLRGLSGGLKEAPPVLPATPVSIAQVKRSEERVIQAVLSDPHGPESSALLQRLRPEDFTASTTHANTWRAMRAVAALGGPVEPVVVAWEAVRLAAEPDWSARPAEQRAAFSVEKMRNLSAMPVKDVSKPAAIVARAALAHHARDARQVMEAVAADPTASSVDAVAVAIGAGKSLQQHADRLTGTPRPTSAISRALAGERSTPVAAPVDPARRSRSV